MKTNGCSRRILLALVLLMVLVPLNIAAEKRQLGVPYITNYHTDEFNASKQNWNAVQDHRGVMYFANTKGLLVSYGNHWELIKLPNESIVRALGISQSGRLYAGGVDEFGLLTADSTGQLRYASLINRLKQSDPIGDVRTICTDSHGIYFATSKNVYFLNENKNKIETIVTDTIGNNLFNLYGKVLNVHEKGISLLEHGKSRPLPGCDGFNKKSGKLVLLPYDDTKMLICSQKEGLFVYELSPILNINNPGNSTASQTPVKLPGHLEDEMSSANSITAIQLNNRCYAISIQGKEIVFIDPQGNPIRRLTTNDGLVDNIIYSMTVDRTGNLWTMGNEGISFIETSSPISVFDEKSGLKGMNLAVSKHNGRIYAGTFNGILYLAGENKGDIKANHLYPVKNTRQPCWDFVTHNDMLFATGRGLYHIDGTSGTKIVDTKYLILSFSKSKKFPDYVFCGLNAGLAAIKIDKSTTPGKPKPIPASPLLKHDQFPEFKTDSIYLSATDKNGDLWLTTIHRGIIHLQFTGPHVTDYKITRYNTSHGLSKTRDIVPELLKNRRFFFDEKIIYEPVYAGNVPNSPISRFEKKIRFRKMKQDLSLTFNHRLMAENKIVFLCNETVIGLLGKAPDNSFKWNPIPFKRLPGLVRNHKIYDNTLWICTTEGLVRYDLETNKNYSADYSALLRRVIINNKKALFNGNFCPSREGDLYKGIIVPSQPPESVPTLGYKENSITFEYSAPFYENATANRFAYKLSGYREEWSSWSDETKAVFTNLAEGDYLFRIKVKNTYLQESKEATYRFSVLPPWYRTLYAIAGYLLALVALFYGGIKLYSRRLIATGKRLEALVAERTAELQKEREIADAANHSKSLFL
ncbi:MAG: hypothetical protein GY757_16190, partial [bacterium]|nr:hypothetical protein [bacterium]